MTVTGFRLLLRTVLRQQGFGKPPTGYPSDLACAWQRGGAGFSELAKNSQSVALSKGSAHVPPALRRVRSQRALPTPKLGSERTVPSAEA